MVTKRKSIQSKGKKILNEAIPKAKSYGEVLYRLTEHPALRYVAGGIATALLSRAVQGLKSRYPEISNVLRENFDYLEEKLTHFSGNMNKSSGSNLENQNTSPRNVQ